MQKWYALIVWMIALLPLHSCVEVIEFDVSRAGGQLVVDGYISDGPGPYELRLSRTADTERKAVPEPGATVVITDDSGRSEAYEDLGDGRYLLPGDLIEGTVGRTYVLHITLANGIEYETLPETIPPLPAVQRNLYFDFEQMQELNQFGNITEFTVINAYVDVAIEPSPETELFLRWDVSEVYLLSPTDFPDPFGSIPPPCYVHTVPDFGNHQLLQIRPTQPQMLSGLKVATQILDHRFDEKHYFNVALTSMSRPAHMYWGHLLQTTNSVGTIFDTPPASIAGNVFRVDEPEEEVLGFFAAVSVDVIRRFLVRANTPLNTRMACTYFPFNREYPQRCLDCLSVPGSTLERPDYF